MLHTGFFEMLLLILAPTVVVDLPQKPHMLSTLLFELLLLIPVPTVVVVPPPHGHSMC